MSGGARASSYEYEVFFILEIAPLLTSYIMVCGVHNS
jgi:hypothetical protein